MNEAALPPCCAECLWLSDDRPLIVEGCAFDVRRGGSRRSLDRNKASPMERQSHSAQQSGRAASGLSFRE
jgi:hypothetical protein